MAKNILNMVLWHPEMEIKDTLITHIHRGAKNNLKKIHGDSVAKLEGGFLILKDGTQIPFHRIIKIEYKDKVLWKRWSKKTICL
ncbi:MAG: RNA repair domain-containing protein [Methanobacteriaceae archaeon]|nr:RNA repair domain-containing protein [Methanobacteriaceae archaeon]